MKKVESKKIIEELTGRYPRLGGISDRITGAAACLVKCYENGNKVLICGNGGSSSDSDHIAGELLKGFESTRTLNSDLRMKLSAASAERGPYLAGKLQAGLPAISLSAHSGLVTAVGNDIDPALIYAQQVVAYGNEGDLLIGLTTSGNSQNVIDAAIAAIAKGMTVVGLTGETGGRLKDFCHILINVPERRTSFVQELHLPVYHTICMIVENHFFGQVI